MEIISRFQASREEDVLTGEEQVRWATSGVSWRMLRKCIGCYINEKIEMPQSKKMSAEVYLLESEKLNDPSTKLNIRSTRPRLNDLLGQTLQ